ncbi:hypothetical protein DJ533_13810 [Acinetobacter defluvii]|uniref:Uncharacterized protein n=1 Tax=Acinetobacter defluvii TaxID=1871111 RepID=A0A2S2FGW1_9GAMM|nr:ABZJ_00895 family protein [Acinetobacter defluvii]AWL29572.1 hypothetical protein DJ533_13810 [Acinetobacter defluvii]
MKRYFLIFSAVYLVSTVILFALSLFVNIPSAGSIPILIAAGFYTSYYFVKNENRVPTPVEKRQLVFGSFICTLLVSGILVTIFLLAANMTELLFEGLKSISIGVILFVFAIASLIQILVLYMSYGWYAQKCLDSQHNRYIR